MSLNSSKLVDSRSKTKKYSNSIYIKKSLFTNPIKLSEQSEKFFKTWVLQLVDI
ncbi:unnamed protein product [Paramecium primaurelia]|uniref:Uncharacterized protein n=1 Tax=Paramecium primaurelia TaxID=5886 RepID=A0A8S1N015_PARPR|nr:unnamed protein product [Paramecium primaurelia]